LALTGGNGTVSGGPGALRGPENGYELCGLSLTPNGNLVAVGETLPTFNDTSPCGVRSGAEGFEITYVGFGPVPVNPPGGGGGGGGGKLKLSVSGVSGSYKDSTVGKSGLKLSASCNQACKLSASLVLSASNAKKLKLKTTVTKCTTSHGHKHCKKTSGYNQVTLASGHATLSGAGSHTFVLKIKGSYIKALERSKSVSVSLQVTATPSSGKSSTVKKTVTFKR
jgi:hypothetical protein